MTDAGDQRDESGDSVDPPEGDDSGDELGSVRVEVTQDVGTILGADEEEYDLSAGDVVELPATNANPLVKHGAAELVDGRGTDGGSGDGDGGEGVEGIRGLFREALEHYALDPTRVGSGDDDVEHLGYKGVVTSSAIDTAIMAFNRDADLLDGTDRQAVVGRVVYRHLDGLGDFFQTPNGRLFYFDGDERKVYRVDGSGTSTFTDEFQAMVANRYNLFSGRFSRNLGQDMKNQILGAAPEKEVYRFAHYDEDAGELYVTDWGDGYYAVSPGGVEWRANGTDVYFHGGDRWEPYDYLPPDERPDLPDRIPGERPMWQGAGDPLMRAFGNRVNYDEYAALSPAEQRKQLYLHLHCLPFVDRQNSRPIMAWVGKKGAGKTVVQRSIGMFIYGPDYRESVMPDDRDDFLTKVSNQALAFVDNYDDGQKWANDILAAVATGSGVDKRELFTTSELRQETPRCWLSITSRDPPFRRDDVADRTLVFRVERVEEGFVGEEQYYAGVTEHRDVLWSAYLDNLRAVVAEFQERDTRGMTTRHRMADWAIDARLIADALDVDGVDELLETMQTERATFALEDKAWAGVLEEWMESEPDDAAQWRKAGSLNDRLEEKADEYDREWRFSSAQGLGKALSNYRDELATLYDLEVDDSKRTNKYRFDVDDGAAGAGLNRF